MEIWTFFHIDLLLKLYCLFEKTENKRKRGRGWPIFRTFHLLLPSYCKQKKQEKRGRHELRYLKGSFEYKCCLEWFKRKKEETTFSLSCQNFSGRNEEKLQAKGSGIKNLFVLKTLNSKVIFIEFRIGYHRYIKRDSRYGSRRPMVLV